jgi:hypothetical protein
MATSLYFLSCAKKHVLLLLLLAVSISGITFIFAFSFSCTCARYLLILPYLLSYLSPG